MFLPRIGTSYKRRRMSTWEVWKILFTHQNQEGLQNVEQMPGTGLVSSGDRFVDDLEY